MQHGDQSVLFPGLFKCSSQIHYVGSTFTLVLFCNYYARYQSDSAKDIMYQSTSELWSSGGFCPSTLSTNFADNRCRMGDFDCIKIKLNLVGGTM